MSIIIFLGLICYKIGMVARAAFCGNDTKYIFPPTTFPALLLTLISYPVVAQFAVLPCGHVEVN
jgi:hypothetical protein